MISYSLDFWDLVKSCHDSPHVADSILCCQCQLWMLCVSAMNSSLLLKMYYEPNASRSNLSVLTSANVGRISLSKGSDEGATTKSVIFIHDGKEYQALVNKRVIPSAG